MKLRRILAAVLAFAMVITASPFENVRFEAAGTTKTISAIDETYMRWSETVKANSGGYLERQGTDGIRNDMPYIDSLRSNIKSLNSDMIEQFDASGEEWHWFAYRVNVQTTGTYTLGVAVNGCKYASYAIPLCVNNEVYTLTYTSKNQQVTTDVTLPIGEHVIVMFAPMPTDASDLVGTSMNIWNDYPWCNVQSVIVDSDLEVTKNSDKQLTDEEVVASFYSKVESGNTAYVTYDHMAEGGYKQDGTGAGGVSRSKVAQTLSQLITSDGELNYLAKESLPYVQYVVDAEADGKYDLNIAYHMKAVAVEGDDKTAFAVIVNDKLYKVEHTTTASTSTDFEQTIEVELKKGRNVIRTTGIIKDTVWFASSWMNYKSLAIESGAKFVPVSQTSVNAGDEATILANKYSDKGTTLGDRDYSILRYDYATIGTLKYAGNKIGDWPFASVQVAAEKDGYYDITVNAGPNTGGQSFQIGMLVDGEAYSLPFRASASTSIDASVYLTAGTHVLTFTSPMPETLKDVTWSQSYAYLYYPWFNFTSFTLGTGLEIAEKPELSDITAHLGTTMEAGDSTLLVNKFGVTERDDTDNSIHKKYSSPDRSYLKDNKVTLNNLLTVGFDKAPYIAYEVSVEKEGDYEVAALIKTNSALLAPQLGVIVDRAELRIAEIKAYGNEQRVGTTVHLTAGTHTIMFTCPMPKDEGEVADWTQLSTLYPWFDVYELYIGNGATLGDINEKTTTGTEAEDTTYVSGGSILLFPGASSGKVVETTVNSVTKLAEIQKSDNSKLLQIDWGQMSYAEFATTGVAGVYDISLDVIATCAPGNESDAIPKVYVYVNGEIYEKTLSAWNTFETITISADLVKGMNIFKCFSAADGTKESTRVFFDAISYDTTKLTAVSVADVKAAKTEIAVGDETQVFIHKFTDKGDYIASPVAGDMQYRKYYIDTLNINQLTYVPYAAVKIAAENAGYYDISIVAGPNIEASADSIAMLVDGKAYALSYVKTSETTLSTMVYLEKGTHMLIFTSPMPKDSATAAATEKYDKSAYPWFDMKTLILDEGLSIVEKPGYGDVDFSEVIDSVDTIIDAGDENLVLPDNYTDGGTELNGANSDDLKSDRVSLETLLLHGFDKAPYASFNVTAPADGTYDIYALVATDANLTSDQIAFIVDRMKVYAVTVEKKADNQIIRATVELTKGTHSIIFTAPLPLTDAEAQAIPDGDSDGWAGMNSKYRWMNYIRFGIDKDLTLVSGLTPTITSGIEAEDEDYVNYHGDFEAQIYPGATGNHAVNGGGSLVAADEFLTDAKVYDWNKMSCIEFAVNAQSAGEQTISIGVIATNAAGNLTAATPKLFVYVNGTWKEAQISSWNEFGEVEITVDLAVGLNVIKCIAAYTEEVAGTRVIYDYIEFDTDVLTAAKTDVFVSGITYNAGDENKILPNHYKDNGETLGGASLGDMQWSKYYINGLEVSQLLRIPHAAMKVTADKDGYYNIGLTGTTRTDGESAQLAVLVDGKAYPLSFNIVEKVTVSASVYLTAGEHTLIFTSPMPQDEETAAATEQFDDLAYPWFDMNIITLDSGLTITEKIRVEEVMLADKLNTVQDIIDAGDTDKILSNHYTVKDNTLQGANRDELKSNRVSAETLLEYGFDKAPYASFNVTADEKDIYYFYAIVESAKGMTAPQILVIVDRTRVVPVSIQKVDGKQIAWLALELEAGEHNLMFTSPMPLTDAQAKAIEIPDGTDYSAMNAAYIWMNYISFAVDKDLTVREGITDSQTEGLEAEDTTYIQYNGAYEVQNYPGASSAQAVVGQNVSTEVVDTDALYYDWNKFAGIEFAVNAQNAGSQEITLGMIATNAEGELEKATPKLMVYTNGEWKVASMNNWNTFEEVKVTVNLKAGTNVIKCIPVASEEIVGTRVVFDYIEYDESALNAVETSDFATGSNTYHAGDEDKFLTNHYTDKGNTLGDASRNPLKEAKLYINDLTISQLSAVPYAAVKVNATADGFYNISMVAGPNTAAASSQIALLVDGKAYALSFPLRNETTLSATMYLTQGTHMLIFTSPMPVDSETTAAAGEYDNSAYPWFNMNTITLSKGLTFAEKPSVAEIDFAEVLDDVDGVINAGDETVVLPNRYTDGGDTLGGSDANGLKDNRVSVETFLLKGFDKAPFASFNVTAQEDGTYDIYAMVQTDAKLTSGQIIVLIDRTQIITVPVEAVAGNQMIHAELPLSEGTHNILFTSPMPLTDEEAQAIPDGNSDGWAGMNGAYRWMNYIRFAIDKDLTVETGITDSQTEGIESENSVHMNYAGGYEEIVFPGASTGKVLGGDDVINLSSKLPEDVNYYDWGQLSYIELALDANKAGKYELTFNVIATEVAQATVFARTRAVEKALPKVIVYANGKLYKKAISTWDEFEQITVEVDLAAGANVIRVLTVADEIKEGDRVFFDYVEYNRTSLADVTVEEVKESKTTVNAGDETKVLFGHYKDNGDTLGGASLGDLQWDKLSLDVLTYDHLTRIPYAAIKVTAEENGYYDVVLGVSSYNGATESTQIGLLVDAKELYVLSFEKVKNPKIHASIYLTKGTHTLVFTSPMPADKETAAETEKFDKLAYPWMDMSTITLSEGLKVAGRPTVDEIETPFYNRVEAENGDYVLYNNYEKTPEANKYASGGYVIGGQMRWIFEQTFEELTAWLDAKHNSYIEYAVVAPADGEYNIRLGFLAGAKDQSVAKPYIAVIVNGTTHKVQYTGEWNEIQKTELTVSLKEGLNIIRCTSYTIEQEGYEGRAWINHDFLDIDKKLTAIKRSSVKVEAENSAFVNKFKVQDGADYEAASGKVLGSADRKYISGLQLTLDKLNATNLKQVPYASFTVEAPMSGYYAMSLDMSTDGRLKRGTIGMLVDGQMNAVKYARTDKSTTGGRAYILTYLTKGEHVLTFTLPMPADATVEFNYSYNVANFDSLTLYDGLKLAKTQKAPTTEADYTRIEVEEHAMFNLNSNNGTAAGNAYYKVSQSVAEMFINGIDSTRTPYAELTIRASEAGAYTLYVGTSYGMTQGCTQDEIAAAFVVDTNGKLQTKTVQASKNGAWSIVPVTVNLEKGTNKVRFTHFGSDSQCGGTTWIDFDYIEMSEATAAKLNFAKTSLTLEAEDGIFVGYNAESSEAYSGGQYIGSADYGYVDENDVTFENLKPDDLDEMPHVTYNFEVEKAGTYTLSVGFAAGLYKYLTQEMAEGQTGGFAVIVNGTSKHLVEYELTTANSHLSRMITVDLVEGENEITITTTLADYIIGHTPRDDEKYRLIWCDHDYLVLSEGLSRGKEPEKYGLADSDYNHAQITLKTASGETDDNVGDDVTNNSKPGGIIGVVGEAIKDTISNIAGNIPAPVLAGVGAAIVAAIGAIIVFIRKKNKKSNNIEESSK